MQKKVGQVFVYKNLVSSRSERRFGVTVAALLAAPSTPSPLASGKTVRTCFRFALAPLPPYSVGAHSASNPA